VACEDLLGGLLLGKVEENGSEHKCRFQVSGFRKQGIGNRE
jgi:hypothetical protein